ncbi:MAG: GNAT family N-acetyltransferase [Candidatus Solibacter usitatus]|nr:GNAT family N-acetyltransferase [Candidatus Solibacter usitatus]
MKNDFQLESGLWAGYLRHCAKSAAGGEIRVYDGFEAAWANTPMPFFNGTVLNSSVSSEADLAKRIQGAILDAVPRELPWLFFLQLDLLPKELEDRAEELFASKGLARIGGLTSMWADEILPPVRPLPEVALERIAGRDGRMVCSDLNCLSYHMPLELGWPAVDAEAICKNPDVDFGYNAGANGQMVSTSTTNVLDDRLYVSMVATHPDHRQKGYAEAVMRHSLEQAAAVHGMLRTVLHASEMGRPLYEQMGYRAVGEWAYFASNANE